MLPFENFQRAPKISKTGGPKMHILVSTWMPTLCQIISVHFLQYLIILSLTICKYFLAVHVCFYDQEDIFVNSTVCNGSLQFLKIFLTCERKKFLLINECLVVHAFLN